MNDDHYHCLASGYTCLLHALSDAKLFLCFRKSLDILRFGNKIGIISRIMISYFDEIIGPDNVKHK